MNRWANCGEHGEENPSKKSNNEDLFLLLVGWLTLLLPQEGNSHSQLTQKCEVHLHHRVSLPAFARWLPRLWATRQPSRRNNKTQRDFQHEHFLWHSTHCAVGQWRTFHFLHLYQNKEDTCTVCTIPLHSRNRSTHYTALEGDAYGQDAEGSKCGRVIKRRPVELTFFLYKRKTNVQRKDLL